MKTKEEYDVLRLIEHNQICYVSSECIKGWLLPKWLKYHPCIEKRELFDMIESIAVQLGQIHRCRNHPCYRYMNPYSIVVSEDRKICFLDMNARENEKYLRIVQRRTVREHFLPPDEPYYQRESVELDIYGLGRTIQYLLSEVEIEPNLTKKEEIKFQKIISRCLQRHSKKTFQNVSEIQKIIPNYQLPNSKKNRIKKHLAFCIGIAVISVAIIQYQAVYLKQQKQETQKQKERKKEQEEKSENDTLEKMKNTETETELTMKLGRVYFLELSDFTKSREYFLNVKEDALAENLAELAKYMIDGGQEYHLLQVLTQTENVMNQNKGLSEEEKKEYYRCLLLGYSRMESEKGAENVVRIGEICLENMEEENCYQILDYMAVAYEKLGKEEQATKIYEKQIEQEQDASSREMLYLKISSVYEQCEKYQEALEILRKGMEENGESEELRYEFLRIQLKDTSIDRSLCVQSVKEQLKECPELKNNAEFQKLMKEQGIRVRGEKVWTKEEE